MRLILANWLERHQNPFSFWIHMIGIPMTVVGVGFWIAREFWIGTALFVGGYVLQWIGHLIEGNDVGEIIPFKKMLGLPYVAIAPQYAKKPTEAPTSAS